MYACMYVCMYVCMYACRKSIDDKFVSSHALSSGRFRERIARNNLSSIDSLFCVWICSLRGRALCSFNSNFHRFDIAPYLGWALFWERHNGKNQLQRFNQEHSILQTGLLPKKTHWIYRTVSQTNEVESFFLSKPDGEIRTPRNIRIQLHKIATVYTWNVGIRKKNGWHDPTRQFPTARQHVSKTTE